MQNLSSLYTEEKESEILPEKMTNISYQSENLQKDHTEEVVIGSEQGTTFPTKIGTTICNALIGTGATRSCMSEKYCKRLHLTKIYSLQNVNVKLATGSNVAPVGLVNCTFELGKIEFNSKFIVCKRPLQNPHPFCWRRRMI